MPFLPLFMGIRHLAHMLAVPPTKVRLLCAIPAGLDLYIQAMPVGTYRVQSPGFPKIVYWHTKTGNSTTAPNSYLSISVSTWGRQLFFPISTPSSHISKTDFQIPSSNRCTHLQQLWQHGPEHSGGCGSAHGCPPLRPSGPPRPPTALMLQWTAPASCVGLGWPLHCPWLQSGRLWRGSWRWRWWASGWRWRWVVAAWCCLAHGGQPPSAPHRKAQQQWHHLPQQGPVSPWQRGQHQPGSACALPRSEQPGGSARVWNVWAGTKARQGPRRAEQRRRLRRKEGKKKR